VLNKICCSRWRSCQGHHSADPAGWRMWSVLVRLQTEDFVPGRSAEDDEGHGEPPLGGAETV